MKKILQILIYGFSLAAGVLFATVVAASDRRVALVIGNSAYEHASTLPNTINDSTAVAALFKSVGFEVVISRSDLGVADFKRSVREFLITAENADIAVVYYAGHGVEIGGINYLVPVDARLSRDYDVEDEAVSLERIIWALQSVRRLRLILLDACRDNPFPAKLRSAGARATSRGGLAKMYDVSADTLVAYAAKAGSISYDGDGVDSPYAMALIRHLAEPGLDIRIALGRVRDDVVSMTGGRQEPFIYGSLGGNTISLLSPSAAKKVEPLLAPVTMPDPSTAIVAPSPPPSKPVVAVAPASPSVPPPSKPVVSPTPANLPPAIEVEPARPPLPARAARETDPCVRDEQRLVRLRSNPTPDEITSFQRELGCDRLRPQVQRLFESFVTEPQPAAVPAASAAEPAPRLGAQAPTVSAEQACTRDAARLAQLRAELNLDAVIQFEQDLGCQRIRPQVRRLRESLGP
jgi:Caspase domain